MGEGKHIIQFEKKVIMAEEKTRYSDEELLEFKAIIEDMLAKAKEEYNTLREVA